MEYNLGRIGIVAHDSYDNSIEYEALDLVPYQGSSYVAKGQTQGNLPTNTQYWIKIAQKGDKGDKKNCSNHTFYCPFPQKTKRLKSFDSNLL